MSIRVAILGTGLAAGIHSKALRAVRPDVVRLYASRDAARASALSARFGGGGHFDGYEAALGSQEVDAVLVALPPSLHLEWTLRALAAGKHVIVEKPPFLTSDELAAVAAAAREAGRQVLVAENYFYKPLTGALRDVIASGDIGQVLFIQITALKRQATGNWRDDESLAGGGALFEGGIHWISLLTSIGLTPVRVSASLPLPGSRRTRPTERPSPVTTERSALVTIDYAEGAVATLFYSWDLPGLINGVRMSRVYGEAGVLRFETNGIFAALAGRRTRLWCPGLSDLAGYRAMTADFMAAIEENRPPKYDLSFARRDLQLVEQAYSSLKDRAAAHP